MTKGKSLFGNFLGFVSHYATEARAVAASLTTILDALPIQHADKARVRELIAALENGADNIGEFLATNPTEPATVKISAKDINKALGDYLATPDGLAVIDGYVTARMDALTAPETLDNSQSSENAQNVADQTGDNRDPANAS